MTTYEFPYSVDEYYGSVICTVSDEEAELIKEAYRDAFERLEEVSDLDELRARVLQEIADTDTDAVLEDDVETRIYFPDELINEAIAEDEEDDEG